MSFWFSRGNVTQALAPYRGAQVHPNLQVSIYSPRWQLDHHVDHHLDHHQHDQHDPHLAHGDVEGSLRLPEARGNVHAVDVAVVGKLEMMMVVMMLACMYLYRLPGQMIVMIVALGMMYTGC